MKLKEALELLDGITEDWVQLADYEDKEADVKKLDKAFALIKGRLNE